MNYDQSFAITSLLLYGIIVGILITLLGLVFSSENYIYGVYTLIVSAPLFFIMFDKTHKKMVGENGTN